jgi:ribosomal protein S18 acetylase RimI-like enzyme
MADQLQRSLREATMADAAAIVDLVNRAFDVERFFRTGNRTDDAQVRELMQRGRFLLLTTGLELTACVYLKLDGERSYIGLLAVDPAAQRTGIGARMMREAEELSRRAGCRFADLRVVSVRPELPAIYRRLGYVETGVESAAVITTATMPVHFVWMSKPLGRTRR